MRYKKWVAVVMFAVMALSGCKADTSAEKPTETSEVTEEVTTTTAEVTTTSANATTSGTTTAKTTTATAEEPEPAKKYFVDCNAKPFDSKALDIFENAFYGNWKCTDTRGAAIPETLVLTYAESPFTFEDWYYPRGIIETDEFFALTYINGGVGGCFVIEKSDSDVMYLISEYNCSDFVIDEHAYIYTDRSDYETPVIPVHDKLSVFGMYRLETEYGEEFTRKFEEAYAEDFADEDGRVWWVDGEMGMSAEKRSIIDRTESSVIITLTYRDKEEYISYLKGNHEVEPTERQFALVFEKNDSEEWELTEVFRADFDWYSELIEKYYLGVWRSKSGEEYIIGKDPENKCVDLLRGRIGYVKKTGNTVELSTRNYIGDEYRLVIDLDDPDTALSYDIYAEKREPDYVPEKFTRTDTAEMYSDTGKLDNYIDSMLYIRYNYFHGFGQEIESYSNDPLVPGYTVLEEHSADRLVWVEPFEDTASEDHTVVYIRYEEVPDGKYWKVDKWEIIDNYNAEPLPDVKAIEEKYGYDIDYDFENDETYQDIVKHYEKHYTEEQLAGIRDIHYLGRYDIVKNVHYINNETADWLVELSWGYYNAQLASFEKYLFIKDGETVSETEIIPMNQCSDDIIYGDTLFVSTSANGIFQLDLLTGEYDFLPGDNWEDIADIDNDYVIYGNGELMIYDRHSRKLITPTVSIGWCGDMDGGKAVMKLDNERIIYNEENDRDVLYYYDIKGECGGVLTEDYLPRSQRVDSDEYSAEGVYDDGDFAAVGITRKSDGKVKIFDMTQLTNC